MIIRQKMRLTDIVRKTGERRKAFFESAHDYDLTKGGRTFSLYESTGSADFIIDNPKAAEQLVIGECYFVDFTPVHAPVDAETKK